MPVELGAEEVPAEGNVQLQGRLMTRSHGPSLEGRVGEKD